MTDTRNPALEADAAEARRVWASAQDLVDDAQAMRIRAAKALEAAGYPQRDIQELLGMSSVSRVQHLLAQTTGQEA